MMVLDEDLMSTKTGADKANLALVATKLFSLFFEQVSTGRAYPVSVDMRRELTSDEEVSLGCYLRSFYALRIEHDGSVGVYDLFPLNDNHC
jgi:hypothetical protein